MVVINIGAEAIGRAINLSYNYTTIALDVPANASGIIDTVEVWCDANLGGFRVGIFYLVSGTTYKCRDSVTIGSVTSGSKQTFTLDSENNPISLDVVTDDYIGCFFTSGAIERDTSGFAGIRYVSGEYIDPNDSASYTLLAGNAISLHGIGVTAVAYIPFPHQSGRRGGISEAIGGGIAR